MIDVGEEYRRYGRSCYAEGAVGASEKLNFQGGRGVLSFSSDFESGNLHSARRVGEFKYELLMSDDTHTRGHTQWFFFKVRTRKCQGKTFSLSIVNMEKKRSLFENGMRPCMYSTKLDAESGRRWERTGSRVRYHATARLRASKKPYYALTFDVTFPFDDDACFLAYAAPYTTYDLDSDLAEMELDPRVRRLVRVGQLCRSLEGREVRLVKLHEGIDGRAGKPVIVFSARAHPGESNSSWVMKGLLDWLVSSEAAELRQSFDILAVPMLNPDGVAAGNYRTSLAGVDLNRRWLKPRRDVTPEVFHLKRLLRKLASTGRLALFVDLHGHSRKHGCFTYGCRPSGWELHLPRALASLFYAFCHLTTGGQFLRF